MQSRVEDVSKPQRAWQQIDSPSDCKHHTLYCCYSLEGKLGDVPTHALTAYFHDLGRFEHLFTEVDTLLPRVVGQHHWSPKSLTGHRTTDGQILSVETALLTSQLSGVVLLLQLGYEGSLPDVTGLLAGTCFGKTELCLDGVPMLEAVRRQARLDLQGSGDSQDSLSLELGRDVHQIVAIASDCQSELIGATPLGRPPTGPMLSLIYRVWADHRPDSHSVRFPVELNRRVGTVGAHARGVTVLLNQPAHVEQTLVAIAVSLLAALTRLREIRLQTESAMRSFVGPAGQTGEGPSVRISRLADQIADLQIALSFGVESHLDSLMMPEVVLDGYRESLIDSLGVGGGLSATTKMLDRLTAAVHARVQDQDAANERAADERRRRWSIAVGYLSGVAVPLTILFAFFAIGTSDVQRSESMLNLRVFWPIYALILGLVLVGVLLLVVPKLRAPKSRGSPVTQRGPNHDTR